MFSLERRGEGRRDRGRGREYQPGLVDLVYLVSDKRRQSKLSYAEATLEFLFEGNITAEINSDRDQPFWDDRGSWWLMCRLASPEPKIVGTMA